MTTPPATSLAQQQQAGAWRRDTLRADRQLVEAIGAERCHSELLCPLALEPRRLVVATPRTAAASALRELERQFRRRVEVLPARSTAVLRALDEETAPEADRAVLARVATALGLTAPSAGRAYLQQVADEAYLGQSLVEAGAITPVERLEAIGLAYGWPSLSLAHHPPRTGLASLVAMAAPVPTGVAPLWAVEDEVFLACTGPIPGEKVRAFEDALGMRARPVLVAPEELPDLTPGQPRRAMRRPDASGDGCRAEEVQASVATRLPLAVVARLGAVPVRVEGHVTVVAMLDPRDRPLQDALAVYLGMPVRAVAISPAQFAAALTRLRERPEGAAGERQLLLLTEAGFLLRSPGHSGPGASEEAVERATSGLAEEDRADALALCAGLPRVRALALFRDANLDPAYGPEARQLFLPLWADQDLVIAAVEAPAPLPPPPARGAVVVAAIATPSDLVRGADAHAALAASRRGPAVVTLGRILERRHGLSREHALTVLARTDGMNGLPTDRALLDATDLSPRAVAAALGQAIGIPAVVLSSGERGPTESADGARGADAHDDAIVAEAAALLSIEQSDALGALPYAEVGGVLQVAVADPLDPGINAHLAAALSRPFTARPAWRAEIAEAARRAHGQPSTAEVLFAGGYLTRQQLDTALRVAERAGVPIENALLSSGGASEGTIARAVGRRFRLPYVELQGADLDRGAADLLDEERARAWQALPIASDGGRATVAIVDPGDVAVLEAIHMAVRGEVRFVVTTRTGLRDGLERLYHGRYLDIAANRLREAAPTESASRVLTRRQQTVLVAGALLMLLAGLAWPIPTASALLAAATAFYLAFSVYKFWLIATSLRHDLEVEVTTERVAALQDRDLPIYTILVPLYREVAVLPILARSLARLDYPLEKLDVKLLLEQDDVETIAAARAARLPSYFDLTIVPSGMPKGKPKACNYGLLHARGDYVVIFDAEDVPEPDQLKRVLLAFEQSPPEVVCVQAKLSYYNRDQNALTRWFTAEYALWFDLLLPGLDATRAPIPLGGTSNHFKVEALLAAGAWDPFNVTEDADLGLRIFKRGGRTRVVDSTTYEEANSELGNWIRQRSRWVKGYIQTYLVHMRDPAALRRQLGWAGFFSFQLMVGGTFFSFLLNPVLWALTVAWFVTKADAIAAVFPASVYYFATLGLIAGNFAFAYTNMVGCLRRGYYRLVGWALLSPLYWVLMSIAAWKGLLQLVTNPFYWEKTVHGLADEASLRSVSDLMERERGR